jgi:hypothetical protein
MSEYEPREVSPKIDQRIWVARFFLVQHTKMGESIPNGHKNCQVSIGRKLFQMAINHRNWSSFNSKENALIKMDDQPLYVDKASLT